MTTEATDEFPRGELGEVACRLLLLGGLRRWHLDGGGPSDLAPAKWLKALQGLTVVRRVALLLHVVNRMSLDRVAEYLGLDQPRRKSTIHMRLVNAYQSIRADHEFVALLESLTGRTRRQRSNRVTSRSQAKAQHGAIIF